MRLEGMSEDEKRLARRENRWVLRFLRAFALSSVYGAIGFFALMALKDGVPALAAACLPFVPQSNPHRLISYATMFFAGIAWFASYTAIWHVLERAEGIGRILKKLAIWCAAAGLVWLAGKLMLYLAIRLALS